MLLTHSLHSIIKAQIIGDAIHRCQEWMHLIYVPVLRKRKGFWFATGRTIMNSRQLIVDQVSAPCHTTARALQA